MFLFHYGERQMGGRRPGLSALPLNVLTRGPLTYYSINFEQHKNFYDFFNNSSADVFLYSVYETFRPSSTEKKFQGYAEIINQQQGEIILQDKRVWLINSFNSKHFNDFVRGEVRDEITKRIVANGQTGSSWYFKRFERLTIIVVSLADSVKLLAS